MKTKTKGQQRLCEDEEENFASEGIGPVVQFDAGEKEVCVQGRLRSEEVTTLEQDTDLAKSTNTT